jgi:hypothetical protein
LDKAFTARLRKIPETLHLVDEEQDWIEKYRAALVQPSPSRRVRLVAALNALAKTLGLAVGKTSGKPLDAVQGTVVSRQSLASHSKDQSVSKKSSPPEHLQDKKAS